MKKLMIGLASSVMLGAEADGLGAPALQPLRVSDNGRFLVRRDGTPFFWLGDTAWALLQKCRREDGDDQPSVLRYLENRARKGFTVIQCRLTEDGTSTDAYGHPAFVDGDYARPLTVPGPDNDYWDTIDWVMDRATEHGLYLAVLPIWAARIPAGHPMECDPRVAYAYGNFLGQRYGERPNLIWVMGGDAWGKGTDVDSPPRLAMTRAIAEGIADGVNGVVGYDGKADWSTTLMTYHPRGGNHSSSELLHDEPWLDFNMIQTTTRFRFTNYATVARDYAKQPPKPTLDGEVAYEWSLSLNKEEPQDRRTTDWEVRKACYWNLFAGGFGHTYGHRSFIIWSRQGESLKYGANVPWYENLDAPGSFQVGYARQLLESRPFLNRIPDPTLLGEDAGQGMERAVATRDEPATYALVYLPTGHPVTVRLEAFAGAPVQAAWFNPRDGKEKPGEQHITGKVHRFVPPSSGAGCDWVLILEK